jgi:hypothetical protein
MNRARPFILAGYKEVVILNAGFDVPRRRCPECNAYLERLTKPTVRRPASQIA